MRLRERQSQLKVAQQVGPRTVGFFGLQHTLPPKVNQHSGLCPGLWVLHQYLLNAKPGSDSWRPFLLSDPTVFSSPMVTQG